MGYMSKESDRVQNQILDLLGIAKDNVTELSITTNTIGAWASVKRFLTSEELKAIHIIKEDG